MTDALADLVDHVQRAHCADPADRRRDPACPGGGRQAGPATAGPAGPADRSPATRPPPTRGTCPSLNPPSAGHALPRALSNGHSAPLSNLGRTGGACSLPAGPGRGACPSLAAYGSAHVHLGGPGGRRHDPAIQTPARHRTLAAANGGSNAWMPVLRQRREGCSVRRGPWSMNSSGRSQE